MIMRIMQMIITMAIIIVRDNNSNNKRERERKQSIQIFKFANRKCFNCFWRRHDVYWVLYIITASLPYDFVLKDFTLRIPF